MEMTMSSFAAAYGIDNLKASGHGVKTDMAVHTFTRAPGKVPVHSSAISQWILSKHFSGSIQVIYLHPSLLSK